MEAKIMLNSIYSLIHKREVRKRKQELAEQFIASQRHVIIKNNDEVLYDSSDGFDMSDDNYEILAEYIAFLDMEREEDGNDLEYTIELRPQIASPFTDEGAEGCAKRCSSAI